MTQDDIYGRAFDVAERLWVAGHEKEATELRAAIDGGATGTEILMAIRWHLRRWDADRLGLSSEAIDMVRDLRRELDKILA